MFKKMTSLFASTAKYFTFDPKKYTMEEFFGDLKTFIKQYHVSKDFVAKELPSIYYYPRGCIVV